MKAQGCMLSGSDYWGTPQDIFDELDKEFDFDLDPCCDERRPLKKDMIGYGEKVDGLKCKWFGSVFVNPPYTKNQSDQWVHKCYLERNNCKAIVLLIPARTDTKRFHDYIYGIAELRFIKGRLKFIDLNTGEPNQSATFPSMLCIYRRITNV